MFALESTEFYAGVHEIILTDDKTVSLGPACFRLYLRGCRYFQRTLLFFGGGGRGVTFGVIFNGL